MLPDQSAVYYPEELSLLGQILDQAVHELRLAALINLKVTVAA